MSIGVIPLDKKFVKPYNMGAGDYVNVTMKDTGVGMDANTIKRVFDPFFTTKEKERGTGLGLASAYGIIKNHDGIITALSEKGQGATFNIYLPAFTLNSKEESNEINSTKIETGQYCCGPFYADDFGSRPIRICGHDRNRNRAGGFTRPGGPDPN